MRISRAAEQRRKGNGRRYGMQPISERFFFSALHRIWVDGTEFRWTREAVAA